MEIENNIKNLVGDITESELKFVECYAGEDFGIFIPSVGYCQYALKNDHTHPSYSFVISVGEKDAVLFEDAITTDSNHYLAAALSPKIPHREKYEDTFSRYYAIFVSTNLFENLVKQCQFSLPVFKEWRQFQISKGIVSLLNRYIDEHINNAPGKDVVLEMISKLITMDLVRALNKLYSENQINHDGIQKIIHYVHQHFSEQIRIPDLATMSGLSATTFHRRFKEETGISPGSYLLHIRLEKAKQLLRADTSSIAEIAYQCGFSNPGHLATAFRSEMGVTPSEYRFK